MGEIKSAWDLAWYGGIAIPLMAIIYTMLQGKLLTDKHHLSVVDELRHQVEQIRQDRGEWRDHSRALEAALDRLSEVVLSKRGRP
jgi:hypothetical protein